MVKEYGEDEDENSSTEDSEAEKIAEEETDQQEINANVGDEPVDETVLKDGNLEKRAMNMIENIENKMKSVEEASEKARKKENEFAKNLEDDYKRIQQVLNNDELSIKDKVEAYDRFESEARVNARSRLPKKVCLIYIRQTF